MTDHRPELRPLTAFRFFAAMAVFFRHVYPWMQDGAQLPSFAQRCMHDGFCGVTFFFTLSGFILTYNYRSTFTHLKASTVWNFFAARVARIGPVHLLTFVVALPVIYQGLFAAPTSYIGPALANLTLTQSFVPDETYFFSFNSVSWSLSDEMFFYALLPIILWAIHATGCGPRSLGALAAGLWLLGVTCVLAGGNDPDKFWLWYINPGFRLLDFFVGVALGQLFLNCQDKGIVGPAPRWATLMEVGSVALVGAALAASPYVSYLLRRSVFYTPFFAAVILIFAFQRGLLSRLFGRSSLRILGEASFSFYMFHYLIIRAVNLYPHVTRLGEWPPLARASGVFAISLIVSICCYRWYEVPARRVVKQWLLGRREPTKEIARAPQFTLGAGMRIPG